MISHLAQLEHYIDMCIESSGLRKCCTHVVKHPLFNFRQGSSKRHHVYLGGLAAHTVEVVGIAKQIALTCHLKIDMDVLITAAIFHDYLKIRDYNEDGTKTIYHDQIRHVSGSYAYWVKIAEDQGISQELTDAIGHCILAHHGRKEWGSPIEPQTVEAQILHFADMLSMEYGLQKEKPNE